MAIKKRKKQRKAQIYFLSSLMFLTFLTIVLLFTTRITERDKHELIKTRVLALDNFLTDFERDAERAINIAGFRALIAMEQFVSTNGSYYEDAEVIFIDVFYTGTINNTLQPVMNQSSFLNYLQRVNQLANNLNIDINAVVEEVKIRHTTPWDINVEVFLDVNITDSSGIANFSFKKSYNSTFSIISLKDPMYTVNTSGKVINTIERTEFTILVKENNTKNLSEHHTESWYLNTSRAPSYIDRFEPGFQPSPNGIESLVYLPTLSAQSLDVNLTTSIVDWQYFGKRWNENMTVCNVKGMPEHFRIDNTTEAIDLYQLTNLEANYTLCEIN
ncbi:hypothetical protein CMO92_02275 [Candidatus Woesearchaeota archaeon]|nr:hypothetical protein [Candidatus Woesearchaeota archaeon]|tara:strand:+ start:6 stop:995 length:990 start_codon:yes stop_codon:yes gene_type:complete